MPRRPARAAARRTTPRLVALLAAAALGACDAGPRPPVEVAVAPRPAPAWSAWTPTPTDLLAQPLEAESSPWQIAIDPAEASAAGAMISGWSLVERAAPHAFVWSDGPRSLVRIPLDRAEPLELLLRCRPFEFPGSSPQEIAVSLNGEPAGRLALVSGMRDYALRLPASALRAGWNLVAFDYARADRPADVLPSNTDRRQLGAAFESIRLARPAPELEPVVLRHAADAAPEPALAQREPGAFGTVLQLETAAELEVAWIAPRQAGEAVSLRVEADSDEGRATLHRGDVPRGGGAGALRLDLGPFAGRALRLRFALEGLEPGARWLWTALRVQPREDPRAPDVAAAPAGRGTNVVLVVLDAAPRSRFGVYGAGNETTPRVDALAREGLVFTDAHSPASYTLASTASLFTGQWPYEHGVVEKKDRLGAQPPTLAEVLRDAGYATAAFSGNGFAGRPFGMERGFDTFEELYRGRSFGFVAVPDDFWAPLDAWLRGAADGARSGDRPFFVYLHFIQPHEPYDVAPRHFYRDLDPGYAGPVDGSVRSLLPLFDGELEASEADRRQVERLFEGNLRFADAAVGRLVEALRGLDLLDRTLLVVTADHGQAFGEHGRWGHNTSVDESMTAIPLVVRFPHGQLGPARVDAPVTTVDVAPLVLDAVGVPAPPSFSGRSPLAAIRAGGGLAPRIDYARAATRQISLRLGDFKSVHEGSQQRLGRAPAWDDGDVLASHPVTADLFRSARRAVEARGARQAGAPARDLSREERAALEALGYVID